MRIPRGAARIAAIGGLLACAVLMIPGAAHPDDRTSLERRVKAAFLYKFTGYIEWPAHAFHEANSPLVIGVVGDRTLASALARVVEGHTAGARPIVVRTVDDVSATGDLHMIVVSRTRSEVLGQLKAAAPRPLLVVSETPGGLADGSMINFSLVEGRVRFEIALPAAERAGLTLSSRLLAVAQSVVTQAH